MKLKLIPGNNGYWIWSLNDLAPDELLAAKMDDLRTNGLSPNERIAEKSGRAMAELIKERSSHRGNPTRTIDLG